MSNPTVHPALDDVSDGDEYTGDPVTPEHDVDLSTLTEEGEPTNG